MIQQSVDSVLSDVGEFRFDFVKVTARKRSHGRERRTKSPETVGQSEVWPALENVPERSKGPPLAPTIDQEFDNDVRIVGDPPVMA
jgi:hypothetical protein